MKSAPNPFVPAGSLMAERQRRNRAQFKIGVYAVMAAHVMLFLGLLIEGCKSENSAAPDTRQSANGLVAPPARQLATVPSQTQAPPRAVPVSSPASSHVAVKAPPAKPAPRRW